MGKQKKIAACKAVLILLLSVVVLLNGIIGPVMAAGQAANPSVNMLKIKSTGGVLGLIRNLHETIRSGVPLPGTIPATNPDPEPKPTPEPIPEPKPAPEPTTNPAPTPAPDPVPTPTPDPVSPSKPTPSPATAPKWEVLGYYAEDWEGDYRSLNSVENNDNTLTALATFSFQIDKLGNITGTTPRGAMDKSAATGVTTLALIHNWAGSGFSREVIHNVLTNPQAAQKAVQNITDIAVRNGYNGVNIDFENVDPSDRDALTAFMTKLSSEIQSKGLKATMSIPAKTGDDPQNQWSGAFDYNALGKILDQMMLMTYDEHYLGGPPGPVASAGWVEDVVKYAVSVAPGEKILMGIGVYGYVWNDFTGASVRAISSRDALAKMIQTAATVNWDEKAKVPYYYYWQNNQKNVLWFESNESAGVKINLVKKYGLKGIAVWRLGFEPDKFWSMVKEKLAAPTP